MSNKQVRRGLNLLLGFFIGFSFSLPGLASDYHHLIFVNKTNLEMNFVGVTMISNNNAPMVNIMRVPAHSTETVSTVPDDAIFLIDYQPMDKNIADFASVAFTYGITDKQSHHDCTFFPYMTWYSCEVNYQGNDAELVLSGPN